MNSGKRTPRKPAIFNEILAYLIDHPEAQDTFAGVIKWWLLEQQIKGETEKVKTELSQLMAEKYVIAQKGAAGRMYYRVNPQKLQEIRQLVAKSER